MLLFVAIGMKNFIYCQWNSVPEQRMLRTEEKRKKEKKRVDCNSREGVFTCLYGKDGSLSSYFIDF